MTNFAPTALLTMVEPDVWHVLANDGTLLVKLQGGERWILGPAKASLVADHGYPPGEWVANGAGGYDYGPTS